MMALINLQPWHLGLSEEDFCPFEAPFKLPSLAIQTKSDENNTSKRGFPGQSCLHKAVFLGEKSRDLLLWRESPALRNTITTQSLCIDSWFGPSSLNHEDKDTPHAELVNHSDATAVIAVLRNCTKHKDLRRGTRIHDDILKMGLLEKCADALITMYAKCGKLSKAKELIDTCKSSDLFTWTALISGYAQRGLGREAVVCFEQMQKVGLSPDAVTFSSLLKACGSIGAANKGARIHEELVHQGLLDNDVVLGTALVDMYAKCGALSKAKQVFQRLSLRNIITWSALITGYAQQGEADQAYMCYEQMQSEGFLPDATTYACVLKACSDMKALDKGKRIHDEVSTQGLLANDVVLGTALVDMYANCGVLTQARAVFANLPYHDVTSWSALIAGYAQHDQSEQALQAFEQMKCEGFSPNEVTFTAVLKACAALGALERGVQLHHEISRRGLLGTNILLDTAIVDMYSKCGALSQAQNLLDKMPSRNIITWSALIAGYAQQGHCQQALMCLDEMHKDGLFPDAIIFSSLLNACSHWGRVDDGHMYFTILSRKYGIKPHLEHYACMIDLFGRTGHIDKAVGIMQGMPLGNHLEIWLVLLGSCRKWGDVNVGKCAFEHVIQLDKKNTSAYVLMADLYATAGMLEDARRVQAMIMDCESMRKPELVD